MTHLVVEHAHGLKRYLAAWSAHGSEWIHDRADALDLPEDDARAIARAMRVRHPKVGHWCFWTVERRDAE